MFLNNCGMFTYRANNSPLLFPLWQSILIWAVSSDVIDGLVDDDMTCGHSASFH